MIRSTCVMYVSLGQFDHGNNFVVSKKLKHAQIGIMRLGARGVEGREVDAKSVCYLRYGRLVSWTACPKTVQTQLRTVDVFRCLWPPAACALSATVRLETTCTPKFAHGGGGDTVLVRSRCQPLSPQLRHSTEHDSLPTHAIVRPAVKFREHLPG